ncbi:MAG: diphthine--ammonia ligase [Anaerolineales bacterium]|nr:diphthine--ammonia ligase [Anaerolineales bacterium]
MISIQGKSFFCSWSGGKDSCLALHRAIQQGGKSAFLLTMFREDGQRSHSHGLPVSTLQRQAKSLGIPLVTGNASWSDYTAVFSSILKQFKTQGIEAGVFGDIDIEDHRQWCRDVCSANGIMTYHPLWQSKRTDLLHEFLDLHYEAVIVSLKQDFFHRGWLGKQLDHEIIRQMESFGMDACGENGEYHTLVTDGPLFSGNIAIKSLGHECHDGYCFLNVL